MTTEKWCSLPRDIIELIEARLISPMDRVRFRSVCQWWRSSVSCPASGTRDRSCSPPYLYFVDTNTIFCLNENWTYRLPSIQSNSSNHRLLGSSNGWLAFLDRDAHDIFLTNPFYGARVDLPSLQSPSYDLKRLGSECNNLCVSPTMTAMFIYEDRKKLAFASAEAKEWTQIEISEDFTDEPFAHVTYNEVDGMFYAITLGGAVVSFDTVGNKYKIIVPYKLFEVVNSCPYGGPYLVSLPTGELFCIIILLVKSRKIQTIRFLVLKLVMEIGKTTTWEVVDRFDGWAVFIDGDSAWAQSSTFADGYKGNCIYYSLQHKYEWEEKVSCSSGVFDMVKKNIRPIYYNGNRRKFNSTFNRIKGLWIHPK